MPGSAPAFRSAARTSSVAMLPTRLSPAKGQPPSPVSARIESAASGFVGGENFFFGVFRAAVQMHAEFDAGDVIFHAAIEIADEFRRGGAHGVGERNGAHANVFQPVESILPRFPAPQGSS